MLHSLDGTVLPALGYFAVAVLAAFVGYREQRRVRSNPDLWPTFWYVTAGLFAVMALGLITDAGDLATQLGRSEAVSQGWYGDRRSIQAMVVVVLGATWFVVVTLALWRVPERRRRYLPTAVLTFTLICFAGVRFVSLHQIDSVLYRRHIAGAQVHSIVELLLLVAVAATTLWQLRPDADPMVPPAFAPPGAVPRTGRELPPPVVVRSHRNP